MRQINIGNSNTTFQPLTQLKETETSFQKKVKTFAETHVAPVVFQMDSAGKFDETLVHKLYEYNLMNIEIPKKYGGEEHEFFHTILAIEEMAKIDPAVAVFIDVQNTLVNNTVNRWADDEQKKRFLPKLAQETAGSF